MQQNLPTRIYSVDVRGGEQRLGVLTQSAHFTFQPLEPKHSPSLTMVIGDLSPINAGAMPSIFSQNLPEGYNRRFIAERLARYARVNDMYLLALQRDQGIGWLNFESDLIMPPPGHTSLSDILTYSSAEPLFPQLLEKYYLSNLLSGVQPKVSLPSTSRSVEQPDLIVKCADQEFELLTVNEFVCMQAAAYCGLNPPRTYLSDSRETFVVERFDRPNGEAWGFEDFATLMRRSNDPDAKYLGSYESVLRATLLYTQDARAANEMYRQIAFNCLIGNGDAHLKNFALQYPPDRSSIRVAPPYDITHTLIYPSLDRTMALKMAGDKAFPDQATLLRLAQGSEARIVEPKQLLEKLASGILEYCEKSDEISEQAGLKQSINRSVDHVMARRPTRTPYRHTKRRKHP